MTRRLWAFGLVLLAAGCGGQVERGERGPTSGQGGTKGSADGAGASGFSWGGPKPLDDCSLGFSPGTPGGACSYLVDGLCYEELDAACACACPTSGTSHCQSSFLDDPPFEVFCY